MHKMDLVGRIEKSTELPKKEIAQVVDSLFQEVSMALSKEESCQFVGFGSFEVKARAARKGVHPRTGAPLDIKASQGVRFKTSKLLKELVNSTKT